jgi:two-component system chemotaxis response regulator CheY
MAKTILIVDDSVTVRQMVGMALRKAGFEVVEGANGREGLERIMDHPVSLVVSDVHMPVMDGIAMTKAIRQLPSHRTTPILLLTTETADSRKQAAREAGATGWLQKPFDPSSLLAVVAKLLPTEPRSQAVHRTDVEGR